MSRVDVLALLGAYHQHRKLNGPTWTITEEETRFVVHYRTATSAFSFPIQKVRGPIQAIHRSIIHALFFHLEKGWPTATDMDAILQQWRSIQQHLRW